MASQLTDAFARKLYYLYLSITDAYNLRCTYCLSDGYKPSGITNKGFLTIDEVHRAARAFASLGTEEVRPTGDEPSLRHDFAGIIITVRENDATRQIVAATNGYRLERDMANWRDTRLTGINISVDSLNARQFHAIIGQDESNQAMAGVDAALGASFEKVKINTVLMRDVSHHRLDTFPGWTRHHPIQLRLTGLMETGEGIELFRKHHVSGQVLRNEPLRRGWIHRLRQRSGGLAQIFYHSDYAGGIGFIMPYEKDFHVTCNRLRIPSIGRLHLCLFGEGGASLRDLPKDDTQQQALEARISTVLWEKKQAHSLHRNNTGIIQSLPYIGG